MENILITGANGFVGNHLAELARAEGAMAFGTIVRGEKQTGKFEAIECDITRQEETDYAVMKSSPGIVFHLAAQSSASVSWSKPAETLLVNVIGTNNILESVKRHAPKAGVVFVSSSECYGIVEEKSLPLTETSRIKPYSPYGMTKKFGEEQCAFYNEQFGIEYSIARFFNICGPGQREDFVISAWGKQVAEIVAGKRKAEMLVGNLNVARDFLDARDAVRGLWKIAHAKGDERAFNICSGKAIELREVLEKFISASGKKITYTIDEKMVRKTDTRKIYGSNELLRKTGWKQEMPIEKTIADVIEYWKGKI